MADKPAKMTLKEILEKLPPDKGLAYVEKMYPEEAGVFYDVVTGRNEGGDVVTIDKNEEPKVKNPFNR